MGLEILTLCRTPNLIHIGEFVISAIHCVYTYVYIVEFFILRIMLKLLNLN